ncbi:MAG: hypothetical protein ACKVQR_10185 [Aquabacterium sp.]
MPQTFNVGARSPLVTFIAWAFIVFGTLASVSAVIQYAMWAGLAPGWTPPAAQSQPVLTGLLLGHLPWFVGAALIVSVAMLASAIGLLMRLEWARRAFIGVLLLAIAANLVGLWLQQEVMLTVVDATLSRTVLPPQVANVFGGFVATARALAVVTTLASCVVLGWLVRRLMSPSVRQEFA